MSGLQIFLISLSGLCWTLTYLFLIYRGFKDHSYGMPLFALSLNIAWEFLYGLIFVSKLDLQTVVNIIWFGFDAVIVYTYFRYGLKHFPKSISPKWFLPWSAAAFVFGFLIILTATIEMGIKWGPIYTAFAQNLLMSVLFVSMLERRDSVDGQSLYAAIFKWIGTVAPTILFYTRTGNSLVLILGLGCCLYDIVYIVMLYRKCQALGIKPLSR